MKRFFLLVNALVFCFAFKTFAQEYAVDKGAAIIGGTLSFSSLTGGLANGEKSTEFTFSPSASGFVARNFFIGASMSISSTHVDDVTTSSFGIGPNIGVAAGNSESAAFPYFSAAIFYQSFKLDEVKYSGSNIAFSGGVLIPMKKHIGLTFGLNYNIISLKGGGLFGGLPESKIFSFTIGLNGLIF